MILVLDHGEDATPSPELQGRFRLWRVRAYAALIGLVLLTSCGGGTAVSSGLPVTAVANADPSRFPTLSVAGGYYDWTTFAFDAARTGYASPETTLDLRNVDALRLKWTYRLPDVVTSQPVLAGNVSTAQGPVSMLYVGSHDGTFVALNADTGSLVWQRRLHAASYYCGGTESYGVDRSATFERSTNRVYVDDGHDLIHALDMSTGKEDAGWPVSAGGVPGLDSPHGGLNLVQNTLYATTASSCDISPWHGRVAALDTRAAALEHTFFTVPKSSGGGVWGQGGASVDPLNGNVFLAVGNADTTIDGNAQNAGYGEHIVELTQNLAFIAANFPGVPPYSLLPGSQPQGPDGDLDFGATPVLFSGPDGSACAAAVNKSGLLVLYNRSNVAGGYTQYILMNPPTDDADFVGLPAYAAGLLYVPLPDDFASGAERYHHGLAALHVLAGCRADPTPVWNAVFGLLPSQTTADDEHSP
ncbi:MAG: PQQ-binding-like beta-propeller repeat protein, partial [Vulcanimicrobiaceae bacterium]